MTDLIERLEYTIEHGIIFADVAGRLARHSECKELIEAQQSEIARLREALDRLRGLRPLLRMITIEQVINEGDGAINAVGLNPWCLNEGLADGQDRALSSATLDSLFSALEQRP